MSPKFEHWSVIYKCKVTQVVVSFALKLFIVLSTGRCQLLGRSVEVVCRNTI